MDDLDTLLRDGLRATPLAADELELLRQISEHARTAALRSRRRRRARWLTGASLAVLLCGGTGAAVASPGGQGMLRGAGILPPVFPSLTAASAEPTNAITCAPQLDVAPGVSPSSAATQRALADGQSWLNAHDVLATVIPAHSPMPAVPAPQSSARAAAQSQELSGAAQAQAAAGVSSASSSRAAAEYAEQELADFLRGKHDNPALVTIEDGAINCEPGRK
ncbi:hypothetical protein ACFOYW_00540 [Gryllotalpicola reticulitermitis]|uniref:Uncharacterized protein n=1 Tax=Gryllotalpicola reticulitermitis TaxID=1184153 RepID=A0ABV8Q2A6_9MICO